MKQRIRSGYTLFELTLYIAIFSVVISGVVFVAMQISIQRVKNLVVSEVDAQGQIVMDTITQSIRNSSAVTNPTTGATTTSATLNLPSASVSPTQFDAAANGGVTSVRIREGSAATASWLTNNRVTVSDLSFSNTAVLGANESIKVQFTLTYYNPGGRNEFSYQKTFYGAATRR